MNWKGFLGVSIVVIGVVITVTMIYLIHQEVSSWIPVEPKPWER